MSRSSYKGISPNFKHKKGNLQDFIEQSSWVPKLKNTKRYIIGSHLYIKYDVVQTCRKQDENIEVKEEKDKGKSDVIKIYNS